MKLLPLLLVIALAGCFGLTKHHVSVWNATEEPATFHIEIVDAQTGETVLRHVFANVPPRNGQQLEHRVENGHPYILRANVTTPQNEHNAAERFTLHSGDWWVTARLEGDGTIHIATLHGD